MKAIGVITLVVVAACANIALCQMYDTRYSGPVNVYGQPVFTGPQQQRPAQPGAPQQGFQGIFPIAASGVYQAGQYFWNYLPAPITGADAQYMVPPGSGQVITSFTPGTR
jgi:hypothetical protein